MQGKVLYEEVRTVINVVAVNGFFLIQPNTTLYSHILTKIPPPSQQKHRLSHRRRRRHGRLQFIGFVTIGIAQILRRAADRHSSAQRRSGPLPSRRR